MPELQFRAWKEELAAHIEKYKHYPAGRPEGDAVIRFVLDQKGHVVSVEVARSSGNAVIDEAALAIVRRADPTPQPPKFVTAADLTFVLPFRFRCDPRSAAAGLLLIEGVGRDGDICGGGGWPIAASKPGFWR